MIIHNVFFFHGCMEKYVFEKIYEIVQDRLQVWPLNFLFVGGTGGKYLTAVRRVRPAKQTSNASPGANVSPSSMVLVGCKYVPAPQTMTFWHGTDGKCVGLGKHDLHAHLCGLPTFSKVILL